jgi:energy-coupling factor transport system ATP-binding protein
MLLQNPFHQIIMQKVRDELTFPLRNSGMGKDEADDQCMEIVEKLQIGHLMDRDISTLSFGETQLVMIAATCLTPADILLMDEPTSHLDPPFVKRFYQCMRDLANEGKSVCITSQSPDEYIFADEIWIMEKGVVNTQIDVHKGSVALKDAGILLDKDMVDKKLEEYGK